MITQTELKNILNYDCVTGQLSWIKGSRKGGFKAGRICNCIDAHGYIQVNINKRVYKAHRLVWLFVFGEMPKGQIDHINHIRTDNRIENLREVNNQKNHLNRPKQSNNKTGFVGVSFYKRTGMYRAYITYKSKLHNLGFYKYLEDGIKARKEANIKFGFHANHGIGTGLKKQLKQQNEGV